MVINIYYVFVNKNKTRGEEEGERGAKEMGEIKGAALLPPPLRH